MIEPLLTAAEVGELLGFQSSTIQDWVEQDKIPALKLGGKLRFRESELADWLEQQRRVGPGAGGEVLPTPTAHPTRGVASQALPIPIRGGRDAC
jgi:excisionase family DNA binding protein